MASNSINMVPMRPGPYLWTADLNKRTRSGKKNIHTPLRVFIFENNRGVGSTQTHVCAFCTSECDALSLSWISAEGYSLSFAWRGNKCILYTVAFCPRPPGCLLWGWVGESAVDASSTCIVFYVLICVWYVCSMRQHVCICALSFCSILPPGI